LKQERIQLSTDSTLKSAPTEPLLIPEQTSFEISEQEFDQIRNILQINRGFSLDSYKDKCIRRRIAIRIRSNQCATVKDYCNLLFSEKAEIDKLLKVLTIHVSQFFRNLSAFEKLRTEIIPHLFATARQDGRKALRFWSLGCAHGEEPYSLALILAEHFAKELLEIPVTIDATDVDAAILPVAENALYNHDRLLETPLNYIEKYFLEEGLQYRLSPAISAMVNFKQGDMFNNQLYHDCDLLLCRNALIYFSREQQEKILMNIASVLSRNGFLLLGKSETITGTSRSHFQTVCPVERIYRRANSC